MRIEITINVIIHATEDVEKFVDGFGEVFGLATEEFSTMETVGHYENPIITLGTKLKKRQAQEFLEKLLGMLNEAQKDTIIREISERVSGSKFHLRLDKHEFLGGNIIFAEKDAIKIIIHTPIYNKRDTVTTFGKIFEATD